VHRRASWIAVATTAAAIGGCGLGNKVSGGPVQVSLTQNFGSKAGGPSSVAKPLGDATDANSGLAGGAPRWYRYVDGVRAATGAPGAGESIWWDKHATNVPGQPSAVVGSFPEPFVHGVGGKRYPVTLDCGSDVEVACAHVESALAAAGVPVGEQGIGTGSGQDTLEVVVGTYGDVRGQIATALIEKGPGASGVYARFAGGALQLLDAHGRVVRLLGASAGLIAATNDTQSQPTWLITGTDKAGVAAAAAALTPGALHDHFALVVYEGKGVPVPVQ
jgi:hypothetical protein